MRTTTAAERVARDAGWSLCRDPASLSDDVTEVGTSLRRAFHGSAAAALSRSTESGGLLTPLSHNVQRLLNSGPYRCPPMPQDRILIVEDDHAVRNALERALRYEGYETATVGDGAEALAAIDRDRPDLVLLDVMMPFVDGIEACRRLRARGDTTPVLMLTALGAVGDRVDGLDAGADDYMVKPFSLDELLARIRALLRRSQGDVTDVLRAEDITVDLGRRVATRDEEDLGLTKTEFDLLELLVRNAGIVLDRSLIYNEIWGIDFATTSNSLDVYVGYLRRKTEAGDRPRLIHTVRGVGYVLRAGP